MASLMMSDERVTRNTIDRVEVKLAARNPSPGRIARLVTAGETLQKHFLFASLSAPI